MTPGPLSEVRVVDFCWIGAGSFATKLLADHGADVIKIENREKLDGLRLSPPFAGGVKGINRSGYFSDRNTSKRSLTLNLKTERGRELALRLVENADVVANNFTSGVMERLGLGFDVVAERNPRAVYIAMSTHGATGPYRGHIGYGSTIAALAGLHELTGLPDRDPVGTGTNYPDHIPNPTHAAIAVLAALRSARRTGIGQYIDLAQIEPTIAAIGPAVVATSGGHEPRRDGSRHPLHAPHGVYRVAGDDRWVAIAVLDDRQWDALLGALDWATPPEWGSAGGRKRDEAALDEALGARIADRDAAELVTACRAAGVPAALVADARDLLADAQLIDRQHWQRLEHPEMGPSVYAAPPFRLSKTPGALARPAPLLGEHTDAIAREILLLDSDEIAALVESGVLA